MAYYFNLPMITQLTIEQQAAIDETESLALSGGPGTGKSVVCLWKHIRNYATGSKKSLLLTYTKTLEHYLRNSAQSQNQESAKNIDRIFRWLHNNPTDYDEIIIDEAQDLSIEKHNKIKRFSSNISYGADEAQSLYSDGCTPEQLKELFPDNEEYEMSRNFRNSKEILLFTRSIFPNFHIPQNTIDGARETSLKPIMKITDWDNKYEVEQIMSIINDFAGDTHNIGILVPSPDTVIKYYDLIRNELDDDKECTKYHGKMDGFDSISGIHITTFKSSKGIEFDTVIIPNFDSFDWMINNTHITEKDYYVAFTRTKIYSSSTEDFLIEENTEYSLLLEEVVSPDFNNIRNISVKQCGDINDNSVFYSLQRGVKVLTEENQLYSYLHSYGGMHYRKMFSSFAFLPNELFNNELEVIDWGCGQALATISLLDYLIRKSIKKSILLRM